MLQIGEVIDGRFEVEALVGQGGLAEVYRVRHVALGSVHALKVLMWRKKSLSERLLVEGRIQAQLKHPNVVAVTDLVRHQGHYGLLMEYVEHTALDAYLEQRGALPLDEALALLAPILSGVLAAHQAGVLHRDLKPSNILLVQATRGVVPKVTDFGIAKVLREGMTPDVTAVGSTMGTPGYLAPEQVLDSSTIDQRADVFALGAIAYECLAGRRCFGERGTTTAATATLQDFASLDEAGPDLPENVVSAVHSALARDPDDRPDSIEAFAGELFADRPDLLQIVVGGRASQPISLDSSLDEIDDKHRRNKPSTYTPTLLPVDEDEAGDADPTGGEPVAPPSVVPPAQQGFGLGAVGAIAAVAVSLGVAAAAVLFTVFALQQRPHDRELPQTPSVVVVEKATPTPPPTPEAAEEPVEPVRPRPGPRPVARPAALPTPTPAPAPAIGEAPAEEAVPEVPPEPEPVPEPQPDDDAVVDAAVVDAAVPDPEPVAPPAPEAAVLVGAWSGHANGRPFQLRVTHTSADGFSGEATFYVGPSQRSSPIRGKLLPGGQLEFRESAGTLDFHGAVSGESMGGNYTTGKKTLAWTLARD